MGKVLHKVSTTDDVNKADVLNIITGGSQQHANEIGSAIDDDDNIKHNIMLQMDSGEYTSYYFLNRDFECLSLD